jgi:hypothetical protein
MARIGSPLPLQDEARPLAGAWRWLALALIVAGCYRNAPPAEPVPAPSRPSTSEVQSSYAHVRIRSTAQAPQERSLIGDLLVQLDGFAEDMCACSDKACADAVSQEMTRWSTEITKEHSDLKPTDEEMQEATKVTEKLSKCMMQAMGYGAGGTP